MEGRHPQAVRVRDGGGAYHQGMTGTPERELLAPREAPGGPNAPRVDEIAFLADVAHLAASARTWEDLMGTVIDRARAASARTSARSM